MDFSLHGFTIGGTIIAVKVAIIKNNILSKLISGLVEIHGNIRRMILE